MISVLASKPGLHPSIMSTSDSEHTSFYLTSSKTKAKFTLYSAHLPQQHTKHVIRDVVLHRSSHLTFWGLAQRQSVDHTQSVIRIASPASSLVVFVSQASPRFAEGTQGITAWSTIQSCLTFRPTRRSLREALELRDAKVWDDLTMLPCIIPALKPIYPLLNPRSSCVWTPWIQSNTGRQIDLCNSIVEIMQ